MATTRVFKRKIYDRMLQWKQERDGKTALLVKGARRVGKSTIVEEAQKVIEHLNQRPEFIKDFGTYISKYPLWDK